jgi:isocitrate/isopropylmalate dehydrogenase
MSATMMLNYLAEVRGDAACSAVADRIRLAYDRALNDDQKTRDLGGSLGTHEFASAVIERLDAR